MNTDIRLYIGGKEIEFNSNPNILFNYKVTDINNPTIVKNSFSKTIEIEGTPKNNEVFQNIWNLERVQYIGLDFNPIKKVDFVLYVNGDIYEKGYAKLDGITTKNNKCTYSITLFGGLGSMFFNLSYKDTEGDDKKSLADLFYAEREDYGDGLGVYHTSEPDLNFRINKEAVFDAWNTIGGNPDAVYTEADTLRPDNYLYDDKWNVLNFAPAYNGIPDDFDAGKCVININNMPALTFTKTEGGTTYASYLGYITGEQPNDELQEWETRDLRSYLQRPAVSMKRVIDACCNPLNNGGYEVILDESFFNVNNPYYEDAWMTLPMLRENIEGGEVSTSTSGEIIFKSNAVAGESKEMKHYNVEFEEPATISQITNVNLGLGLDLKISSNLYNDRMYLYSNFTATPSKKGDMTRVSSLERISSISVQLVAYDELEKVVASSNVYFITDILASGKASFEKDSLWFQSNVPVPGITNLYGSFNRVDDYTYRLVDGDDNPIIMGFNFNTETTFNRLELKVLPVTHEIIYYMNEYKWWKSKDYNGVHKMEYHGDALKMFTKSDFSYSGDISIDGALSYGTYAATADTPIYDFKLISKDYSELFSDTYIRKEQILKTESTPADYLIGYCKMFGLNFYLNPSEEATNPELAPRGVVHIMTRDTYYTGEIVNLEEFINRDKGLKITPTTMTSKYFNLNIEQVDSEVNKEYKDKYGYDYGYQKINTGYDFNTENKALLDKIPFKGGVDVLETSKYYQKDVDGYPAYGWNGFIYTLFNIDFETGDVDTLEVDDNMGMIYRDSINKNGWEDTDAFKKPQFHEKDNGGIEGNNVLLFFNYNKWYDTSFKYWLTDDLEIMVSLNEGKPCWIMTAESTDITGNTIAYPINTIPIFERNIVYSANGTIRHSWDFGNPFMTYVRDMYNGEQSGIYEKCWKDYISDLYSQDNRTLTAYVVFKHRPNVDSLRKFYWFDNCLWRMNAIKDWNVCSNESTLVEFVKVIDEDNYTLTPITDVLIAEFTFPNLTNVDEEYGGNDYKHYYTISSSAQDVTGVINVGNAGSWVFGDGAGAECYVTWEDDTYETYLYSEIMTPRNDTGQGDAIKVFALTENEKEISRTWHFNIIDDNDRYYNVYIIQEGNATARSLSITPTTITAEASGGTYTAQIYYKNRGDDTLTYDFNEGEAYQYFTWSLSDWDGDYATLSVVFEENTTPEYRSGAYLQFTGVQSGLSCTITLNQQQPEENVFVLNTYSKQITADAQGVIFTITDSNASMYTVTSSVAWLSRTLYGDNFFSITASENTAGLYRIGMLYIDITYADGTTERQEINITQAY